MRNEGAGKNALQRSRRSTVEDEREASLSGSQRRRHQRWRLSLRKKKKKKGVDQEDEKGRIGSIDYGYK